MQRAYEPGIILLALRGGGPPAPLVEPSAQPETSRAAGSVTPRVPKQISSASFGRLMQ